MFNIDIDMYESSIKLTRRTFCQGNVTMRTSGACNQHTKHTKHAQDRRTYVHCNTLIHAHIRYARVKNLQLHTSTHTTCTQFDTAYRWSRAAAFELSSTVKGASWLCDQILSTPSGLWLAGAVITTRITFSLCQFFAASMVVAGVRRRARTFQRSCPGVLSQGFQGGDANGRGQGGKHHHRPKQTSERRR